MPVTAFALLRPAPSCFPDPESKNLNRLRLISPARTRGTRALRANSSARWRQNTKPAVRHAEDLSLCKRLSTSGRGVS